MAVKKTVKPGSGNPGGQVGQRISSNVKVLGKTLEGFTGVSNPPRKALTPAQLKEAKAIAARIKSLEVKAANEKKANAKIIKKQNKEKPLRPDSTKANIKGTVGKKPVVKVTPPKGRPGLRGGGMGGGGLFGGRGLGQTR